MTTSILVTGAAGFVGGHLLPELRRRLPDTALIEASFDIVDPGAVAAGVVEAGPTAVIHLATVAAPAEASRDPDLAWRVNLDGTLNLARAMIASAPGCSRG